MWLIGLFSLCIVTMELGQAPSSPALPAVDIRREPIGASSSTRSLALLNNNVMRIEIEGPYHC